MCRLRHFLELLRTVPDKHKVAFLELALRRTSAGAVLLWAVLPQLAVVLLSLSFKSCGCDLTAVPIARVPVVVDGPKT